jgi:hypothetical protein
VHRGGALGGPAPACEILRALAAARDPRAGRAHHGLHAEARAVRGLRRLAASRAVMFISQAGGSARSPTASPCCAGGGPKAARIRARRAAELGRLMLGREQTSCRGPRRRRRAPDGLARGLRRGGCARRVRCAISSWRSRGRDRGRRGHRRQRPARARGGAGRRAPARAGRLESTAARSASGCGRCAPWRRAPLGDRERAGLIAAMSVAENPGPEGHTTTGASSARVSTACARPSSTRRAASTPTASCRRISHARWRCSRAGTPRRWRSRGSSKAPPAPSSP